jgi:hypothetical protein
MLQHPAVIVSMGSAPVSFFFFYETVLIENCAERVVTRGEPTVARKCCAIYRCMHALESGG